MYDMKLSNGAKIYLQSNLKIKTNVRRFLVFWYAQFTTGLFSGHNFKYFLPISIVCAFGFFNRPTFILFAFVPLFFWFMRGVAMNSSLTPFQVFNFRCLSLVPGTTQGCHSNLVTTTTTLGQIYFVLSKPFLFLLL